MRGLAVGLGLGLGVHGGGSNVLYSGADLALDFAANRYRRGAGPVVSNPAQIPGWSYSRSGQELAADAAGAYRAFATDVPAINDLGLHVWEARTNKSTNFNAAPTDLTNVTKTGDAASVLSVVSDVAEILSVPELATLYAQGVLNGNVYKLDNSAGVALANIDISGQFGNTNAHTISAYIRGGSGKIGQTAVSTSNTDFISSATYRRVVAANVTIGSGTRTMRVAAAIGETIYVLLNQLEEGAYATPPIVVAGAAATRAHPLPDQQVTLPAGAFTIRWEGLCGTASGAVRMFEFHDGTDANRIYLTRSGANSISSALSLGGSVSSIGGSLGFAQTGRFKSIIRYDGAGNWSYFAQGAKVGGDLASALPPITAVRLARRTLAIPPLNGSHERLLITAGLMGDAQLQALTT
jgi:hypothetical protein